MMSVTATSTAKKSMKIKLFSKRIYCIFSWNVLNITNIYSESQIAACALSTIIFDWYSSRYYPNQIFEYWLCENRVVSWELCVTWLNHENLACLKIVMLTVYFRILSRVWKTHFLIILLIYTIQHTLFWTRWVKKSHFMFLCLYSIITTKCTGS